MNQKITGFHQDRESHWVAELACGHGQHTRHDPPWQEREWVTTSAGRANRLGFELNCVRCDEAAGKMGAATMAACKRAVAEAYESAGTSGLCEEGRFEAALGACTLSSVDLKKIAEEAMRES